MKNTSSYILHLTGIWDPPSVLHWISTPIPTNDDCAWSIGSDYEVTDNMICAGEVFETEQDACQVLYCLLAGIIIVFIPWSITIVYSSLILIVHLIDPFIYSLNTSV